MTLAPKTSNCATFAGGADLGAKIMAFCPTAADMPARAAPALPVEAVTTTSAPISCARATTMAEARSLKEAVGLRDSSLSHRYFKPSFSARRDRLKTGVPPAACSGVDSPGGSWTGNNGKKRQRDGSLRERMSSGVYLPLIES